MAFSYPEKTGMVPHIGGSGSQSYNLIIAAVVVGWLFINFFLSLGEAKPFLRLLLLVLPYPLILAISRIKFHPLSSFPGPYLWSVSRIPMFYHLCCGTLPQRIADLHAKYGEVVRIAPGELSFVCEEAWGAIYDKPAQKPQLAKDPTQFVKPSSGVGGLFHESNDKVHGQVKRNFSHAFAEKTLLEQERIIQSYITVFLDGLRDSKGKSVDICNLLNCLTFDTIGDLSLGQSFGSLEDSTLHPWIENIFKHVALMVIFGMIQKFTWLYVFLTTLMSKQMKEAEEKHHNFILDRLDKRLAIETNRPDFITHVQRFLNKPTGISHPQLAEAVNSIIIGGSETVSTVLSAALYLLLSNPLALQKLKTELRSSFLSSPDITMRKINALSAAGKLDYLDAVVQEALRLYAPTPGNLTRVTPEHGIVVGEKWVVPGGVLVGVNLHAAGRYEGNYKDAIEFVPERWLKNDLPERYIGDKLKSVQAFSRGPRNCIGKNLANMQMRLILSRLLFEFDIRLDPASKGWSEGIKIWGFYSRPELFIQVEPEVR